jgi:cell wall-associated NlpC family hydrolase
MLLATVAIGAALYVPVAASASSYPSWAPDVPWGAGCEPTPSPALRTAANRGATLVDGQAVPPPGAPSIVRRVIAAADEIDNTPYIWGGGHASFTAKGYDCSGAVSYGLHGAGLLSYTMVSESGQV